MFLSRLTGGPIGLTVLNLFVIDKPAILTVSFHTWIIVLLSVISLCVHLLIIRAKSAGNNNTKASQYITFRTETVR